MMQNQTPGPQRKHTLQACDFCHSRGLKCHRLSVELQTQEIFNVCLTCIDYCVQCTMGRHVKRRGSKPTVPRGESMETPSRVQADPQPLDFKSPACIRRLIEIYRDTMHQC
ncbi:hypothetical protein EDB82DRAFT_511174 [Fusarium venenatum]|uniref:uncharacterized protein n=1 Tax=Fusarium venenatum TaxID=56646 RepID=UPI001D980EB4|nr:hypothetical protein EDB82DRAFT_511174 [Fusarium venenatum]